MSVKLYCHFFVFYTCAADESVFDRLYFFNIDLDLLSHPFQFRSIFAMWASNIKKRGANVGANMRLGLGAYTTQVAAQVCRKHVFEVAQPASRPSYQCLRSPPLPPPGPPRQPPAGRLRSSHPPWRRDGVTGKRAHRVRRSGSSAASRSRPPHSFPGFRFTNLCSSCLISFSTSLILSHIFSAGVSGRHWESGW